MMDATRASLKKLGLPDHDLWELPTSSARFPDGAQFRLEVPTVNSAESMQALVDEAKSLGVVLNRVDETFGIMRHTDRELKAYIEIAKRNGIELNLSIGPRATYDTSATAQSPQGMRIGYRLRGVEQLVRAIEDVKRVIELGCRGILVYDEGLLWVLNEMRKNGDLPRDLRFKVSAHMGHGNPAAAKLFENLGADSFNPVRDLQLPMIAALRAAIKIPLDCHTDNPAGSGGFIRTYEAPEMVRIGAPIHLKCGNSALAGHGEVTGAKEGKRMAEQAWLVLDAVEKFYPSAVQTKQGASDLAVPR
jgi:hypothetical protein